jgi:hypothetical protein
MIITYNHIDHNDHIDRTNRMRFRHQKIRRKNVYIFAVFIQAGLPWVPGSSRSAGHRDQDLPRCHLLAAFYIMARFAARKVLECSKHV